MTLRNLARMTTPTTGIGTLTLGSAVAGWLSFAQAGVQNGETVTYAIEDGTQREVGRGTYTASGTTLTRSVLASTNGGNPITLSGSAQVFITAAAEDIPLTGAANSWSGQQSFTAQVNLSTSADYGTALYIEGTSAGSGGPLISTKHNSVSPANFDTLLLLYVQGKDSGGGTDAYCQLYAQTVDVTPGSEDGRWAVVTMVNGVSADRFYFQHGEYANGASGGDKGDGTINAKAVYDDNSLLTCYVFDAVLDGRVDAEKWDAKVPPGRYEHRIELSPPVFADVETPRGKSRVMVSPPVFARRVEEIARQHDTVRRFAARLGTEQDPLTLDGYAAHWKEKRHLTSMPNEANFKDHSTGQWIQRLVEAVEIQAVLIEQLNERLKTLEGK